MRLKAIVPALPADLISALDDCGVRTDADLLFNSGTAMQLYEKLPEGVVTLAQLERYIRRVTEFASAPMFTGEDLVAQETKQRATFIPISTGVPQLDEIINGTDGPKVLEISGDHGTGKTLFALQVVMRHLASHAGHAALWIDTTGDFSATSLQSFTAVYDHLPATHSAAERLQLLLAFDVNAVQEALDILKSSQASKNTCCLVIDSITPIFRPLLSAVSSQGHAMMTSFMQQLRWVAETYSMTVMILNASSSALPQDSHSASIVLRKPALGPSFAYMTDATLWLTKDQKYVSAPGEADMDTDDQNKYVRRAEILRSKYTVRALCGPGNDNN
ncbi:P-loop containing nucleoside triphosphate hydrolase protein [Irpex rosettiformis]|uniref:P-loop containing nucleoside triphosphate hydrolase protein n=1 Tax=Irpex rosettiformis TaxID=378272 RepID=A0ACB8TQ57_9APHY|nr:P-loop containing nucleoside triphosphate hydrolase protein [Irpex rosettiformis]